jgi:hypothetical protein
MQLEHRLVRDADHGAPMPAPDDGWIAANAPAKDAEGCAWVGARDWWSLAEPQSLSDRNAHRMHAPPSPRFQEFPALYLVKPEICRNHRLGVCPQIQQN